MDISKITPHLEVKARIGESGSEWEHVATVDHMDSDDFIKLTRKDSDDGQHHWIPVHLVERADEEAIYLTCDSSEFLEEVLDSLPADTDSVKNAETGSAQI